MRKKSKSVIRRFLKHELYSHPFMVPAVTLVVLSVLTLFSIVWFGGSLRSAGNLNTVQLTVEGEKQTIPTRAVTVGDMLERLDVNLHDNDVVEPSIDTAIDADDFRVNVYRAKPVTILDEDKRIQAFSAASTPRSIAAQAGVKVFPEDKIEYADAQDALRDHVLGANVVIERATEVQLILYGTPTTIRTHASTVEELLAEKSLALKKTDTVKPKKQALLSEGIEVQINRQGVEIVTETVRVDNPVEYVEDDSLSFGTTAVRQAGSPGKKLITYEVKLVNGQEVSRKKLQEVVSQQPVPRIIARGQAVSIPADKTRIMAAAGITPGEYPYVQYILNNENRSWCPTRWQGQAHCPPYYEPIYSPSDPTVGYGLCQSTPAIKMADAGADWKTNAVTQLRWCDSYAVNRYGSWAAAYEFWVANHWW